MEFPSATVQQALNSLASCIRCRERRVGCDRLLPSCQACTAIGADCELYDHVLDAKFPRSYLQQLHLRLQHLEQLEHQLAPAPKPRHQDYAAHVQHQRRLHTVPSLPSLKSSSSLSDVEGAASHDAPDPSHDLRRAPREPRADDGGHDTRGEWGPSSALQHLRLVATLLNVELTRPLYQALSFKVDVPLTQPQLLSLQVPSPSAPHAPLPPRETSQFLLEFYYNSIDSFIPVLGRKLGDQDLQQLYTNCSQRQNMRACTRAQLALAIAARFLFRSAATQGNPAQSQAYLQLSDSLFDAAVASLKTVLSDSTQLLDGVSPSAFENEEAHAMAKLQIVLLLVCYVLCAPQKGNVWQLLGFAERLWRNMQNARAQLRRSNSPDGHLVREQARHRPKPNLLYCSFVSLERMVGMAYGRPIDFLDFAEADEPTHRPDDKSTAALYAKILELKQSVHASYLSGQQEPGGILGPAPGTPKTGSHDWFNGIRSQADAWFERWVEAIEIMARDASPVDSTETQRMTDGRRQFWLCTGRKWRDETLHLAFGLLLQNASTPASTPASGKSPTHRQHIPLELLTEGRSIVNRLVNAYAYLLRQPFTITHQGAQIPLVFPRLWVFDLEIFRTAITAAYLSHHQDGITGRPSMTWEVSNCIKLLSSTSAEVDAEGLCEAILTILEVEG
ncbi:putative positive regulator of purine utilization protein [Neofusicoccum parvum]|uniref:Positive regulator of purine utilization protein n=1 Tax=Neofusicoccum parvum TaxID=310453 RepID=A0ACB5SD30_9PEZI|nr:putative positive regulator of purine utilization protein [Neofusicoccum parvum]GME35356.1 putative positive regulator of purine utilization protein [Neofusicoccum parvum]